MELKIESAVAIYMRLRGQKATIEARAKEEVAGINEKLDKIEAWIKLQAQEQGVTSFKTAAGTAFLSQTDFATVADWDQVLEFVLKNEAYTLLTKGVNKLAVREYLEEHTQLPPGVNYGTKISVNVRKPAPGAGE